MEKIIIVDFGSQVTKLIARRVREMGVYSQITPYFSLNKISWEDETVKGIIFSGGPRSVNKKNSPKISDDVYLKNTHFRDLLWTSIDSKKIWWVHYFFKR